MDAIACQPEKDDRKYELEVKFNGLYSLEYYNCLPTPRKERLERCEA